MLSVNGWNWDLVTCRSRTRLYNGRLAKAIMRNCGANVQGQIWWGMHKSSYEGYLHKSSLGNCGWRKVFWTTDLEKCKTTDLVRESKRRFGLVVRLIANKYYGDTFYFLSFLPTVLTLPSLASYTCLIFLHRIICGIIWLARSYLELPTLAESFVTLRARPKVRTSETR